MSSSHEDSWIPSGYVSPSILTPVEFFFYFFLYSLFILIFALNACPSTVTVILAPVSTSLSYRCTLTRRISAVSDFFFLCFHLFFYSHQGGRRGSDQWRSRENTSCRRFFFPTRFSPPDFRHDLTTRRKLILKTAAVLTCAAVFIELLRTSTLLNFIS